MDNYDGIKLRFKNHLNMAYMNQVSKRRLIWNIIPNHILNQSTPAQGNWINHGNWFNHGNLQGN